MKSCVLIVLFFSNWLLAEDTPPKWGNATIDELRDYLQFEKMVDEGGDFRDPWADLRFAAAKEIERRGSKAAILIPDLIKALEKPDAYWGCYQSCWAPGRERPDRTALIAMEQRAVPALLVAMKKDKANTRRYAVSILGSMKVAKSNPKVIEAIIAACDDPFVDVRQEAVQMLAGLDSKGDTVAEVLADALKDSDEMVRFLTAQQLGAGQFKSDKVVPALINATRDPSQYVRLASVDSLGIYGSENVAKVLLERCVSPDEIETGVAWHAVDSLGKIGPAAKVVVPVLVKQLNVEAEELNLLASKPYNDRFYYLVSAAVAIRSIDPTHSAGINILQIAAKGDHGYYSDRARSVLIVTEL